MYRIYTNNGRSRLVDSHLNCNYRASIVVAYAVANTVAYAISYADAYDLSSQLWSMYLNAVNLKNLCLNASN